MTRGKVGSLSSLREMNRLRVLEVVRERGAVSRSEIAESTGLARSTVSTLIGEFQRAGLVVEQEEPRSSGGAQSGRPPVLWSLDPSAGAVLGVQLDHHYVRVAVADLSLGLLAEGMREIDVDHDAVAGVNAAAALSEEVLTEAGVDRERLLGAGIGLAGPIDRRSGAVGSSTILPGWIGMNVAAELGARLEVPVHVDNDANLGALSESVLGAGRGATEMAYLMLSSGIGAGLILGGRLYRGAGGTAGEIGHVVVDENGAMCRCGNRGCLETFVGAAALLDLLRRSHGEDLTLQDLIALAQRGDPGCRRVLADAGRTVGSVVAALCNQFNPELVVVGGELAAAGEMLMEPLRQAVRRLAIPAAANIRVLPGELGERAELFGALALVLGESDRALSGRLRAAVGR